MLKKVHIQSELDRIIEERLLHPFFQPMVNLSTRTLLGYEGLIRGPEGSPLHQPSALFEAAKRYHRLLQLDFLCWDQLIRQFSRLRLPGLLFLNTSTELLRETDFLSQMLEEQRGHLLASEQLVIEITGTQPLNRAAPLNLKTIKHYQDMGFTIALDNLGGENVGLKLWSQILPTFVKTDRYFSAGIHENRIKHDCLYGILENAARLHSNVIVTGVQTQEEFDALRQLGLDYLQGFYIGKPSPHPETTFPYNLVAQAPRPKNRTFSPTAKDLLMPIPQVVASHSIKSLAQIFENDPGLPSIAIIEQNVPVGLVTRNDFLAVYASQFGRDLYQNKPVTQIMRSQVLKIGVDTPIDILSKQLTNTYGHYTTEILLVDSQGQIAGKSTLLNVLKAISEYREEYARYANPLTLLPGNVPIQRTLEQWLDQEEGFAVAYFDLNHFKPFNDHCGYAHGDQAIKLVADLLTTHADPELDFIGHIGGDDFIALYRHPDWLRNCHCLLEAFRHQAPQLYSESQQANDCIIEGADRFGNHTRFPIISLAIGIVEIVPSAQPPSRNRISELASRAKKHAKKMGGNAIFVMPVPEK